VSAPLPPLGPGCFGESAGARTLFVQDRVRGRLFDDVAGAGFALVSAVGDPGALLAPENRAWFAALGGVCAHVGPDGEFAAQGDGYARWFVEHGAQVALQRPDFHVFGTAPELGGANALVEELRRKIQRGVC
jgi:hypothetical protein